MRRLPPTPTHAGRLTSALAIGLLLASCGSDETGGGLASSIAKADAPAFAAVPGALEGGGSAVMMGTVQPVIGGWRERIIKADGTINAAEYRRLAASYNTSSTMSYRLGPRAIDFGVGTNSAPQLWGPDMKSGQALWPYGTQPASDPGEPKKCLPPSQQPRSDEE